MRTLSQTLLAAQRSPTHTPYLKVEVVERVAGVARLAWSRLYTGAEPDYHHAAAMPADGSLNRARVAPSDHQLYRQRVVNPGPGSDFSNWTPVATVSDVSGIALASYGSAVLLFYVGTDQTSIYVQSSPNYGADWGSPVLITTTPAPVGWLAADFKNASLVSLFYSVGGTVYVVQRSGGVWGSPSPWSNSLDEVAGLACVYYGDWNLALCGRSTDHLVATCVYGDGYSQGSGTWSTLAELSRASAASGVEFRCPFMSYPEVFRLSLVEEYTGAQSYSRPLWCHSLPAANFIDNLWHEPVPFDLSSEYGLAIASSGDFAWLSTPSGVWRAALFPSPLDLSADVLSLTSWAQPGSGRARVELRNDDGRYLNLGSGSYAAIKIGSELRLSPGYLTASGLEVSPGPACWIEGWEHTSRPARLILHAHDAWGLLERWRARRQFSWSAGDRNIFQLLAFIFARAGLELAALSYSPDLVGHYPAFTVHPGESGAGAVRRLLAMVPDVILIRGSTGYIIDPQPNDASLYSYGTDHTLLQGSYGRAAQPFNRVQVYGHSLMAESFAWDQIHLAYDRLLQVHDLNLDSVAQAQQRGQAELRRQSIAALSGQIVIPTNCGQELYDVIDITDPSAGLSQAKRRVLGLTLHYFPRGASYQQQLDLGDV